MSHLLYRISWLFIKCVVLLINLTLSASSVLYLWLSKILANQRRWHKCKVFLHWLILFSAIHINFGQPCASRYSEGIFAMAWTRTTNIHKNHSYLHESFSNYEWCRIGFWWSKDDTQNGQQNPTRRRGNSRFYSTVISSLQWRHNGRNSVSYHQPNDCLLNRLFRRRSMNTSKLRVTGLCVGNLPGPVNSSHKWPVKRKMFPFDDVIMMLRRKIIEIPNVSNWFTSICTVNADKIEIVTMPI